LLQQNHARQLMRQSHLAKREDKVGCATGFVAESTGWANAKEQILSSTVLLVTQQVGKLF
jgi:hypothetical protein